MTSGTDGAPARRRGAWPGPPRGRGASRAGIAAAAASGLLAALAAPRDARAQSSRAWVGLGAEATAAHALDATNSALFGFGFGGALYFEFNPHPLLGLHVGGTGMYFLRDQSAHGATWFGGRGGLRFHWGVLFGLASHDGWVDAHYDYGVSGPVQRSGFDVGVGFDLALVRGFRLGPFARYQWASDPRGDDPHMLLFGLSIGVLGDPRFVRAAEDTGPRDHDRDGVLDADDRCPTEPAGAHPDPNRRGCPARDSDGDAVFDADDVCPTIPAGAHPEPNRRGCPASDRDLDGVFDSDDVCPTEPAGAHPDPDRRGCPARDSDGDGVYDARDQCPAVPAGARPDPNRAGCPTPDRDNDTVADPVDRCPDQPGAPSRDPARNGCPGLVRVEQSQIRILRPVFFATNRDTILETSFPVLAAVADAVAASGIRRLRVEGHSDNRGNAARNLRLSQRRAASVARWLTDHGMTADQLESEGLGQARPVESNDTALGRAANRRVEFHILDVAGGSPDAPAPAPAQPTTTTTTTTRPHNGDH